MTDVNTILGQIFYDHYDSNKIGKLFGSGG